MRSGLVLLCIALQLGVLSYMVYGRESVVASGKRIYMATAPIDPRDPFRGDFVRLQYAANSTGSAPNLWSVPEEQLEKGDIVYALLEERPSGLHEVVLFTDIVPDTGLYIRGRRSSSRSLRGRRSQHEVRFGIEQLFVEQGSGIAIEEKRGVRGGLQTAMEVELAVDGKGTAVLTDFRWSELGIQIELTDSFRLNRTGEDAGDEGPHIIVSVQNVSDSPLTLNNPGDNCGFRLEPAGVESKFSEAENSCTDLEEAMPLTLASGQTHTIEVNLSDSRWYVNFKNDGGIATGDLRQFESTELLRIVYRGVQMVKLSEKSSIESEVSGSKPGYWSGDLISQGFNPRGRID